MIWYIFLFATSLLALINYNKEQKCDSYSELLVVILVKVALLLLISYSLDKIIETIIKLTQHI